MADDRPQAMFFHSTYFKLAPDRSPESYMAACKAYLSSSDGLLWFAVGLRDQASKREVNDRDFDIAMHQVFENADKFALYNGHDTSHDQFVFEVNRWSPGSTRRVLDASLRHFQVLDGNAPLQVSDLATGQRPPPRVMHSVYFSLVDKSEESRAKLVAICLSKLQGHAGQSLFAIGDFANPLQRPVNVSNYDIAMDIQWLNRKSYDDYLVSERHKEFFPLAQGMIDKTFVFDADLRYEKTDRAYSAKDAT